MRVCQPGPVLRKCSTTSASIRSLSACLGLSGRRTAARGISFQVPPTRRPYHCERLTPAHAFSTFKSDQRGAFDRCVGSASVLTSKPASRPHASPAVVLHQDRCLVGIGLLRDHVTAANNAHFARAISISRPSTKVASGRKAL